MERNIKTAVHNRFDFEVADAATGEVKQRYTSYNIITDGFFSQLMGLNAKLASIVIGTGSGTLSQSNSRLFTYLGGKHAEVVELVKAYPTSYVRKKIILNPGDFVGKRITEVGYCSQYSGYDGYPVTTHSMLKDSEGNQIAILKTATDVITIYATFYVTLGMPEDDSWVLPLASNNAIIAAVLEDSYSWYTTHISGFAPVQKAEEVEYGSMCSVDSVRFAGNAETKTFTYPTRRFDYNVGNTHVVNAIGCPSIAVWRLPNSMTFPDVLIEQIAVGTGDGTATVFDCPIPNIVAGSEHIRKNNVLLERGVDYTLDYENNCMCLPELFLSCDPNNYELLQGSTCTFSAYDIIGGDRRYKDRPLAITKDVPILMDFKNPITVDYLRIPPNCVGIYRNATWGPLNLKFEYSLDNETWIEWYNSGTLNGSEIDVSLAFEPALSMRYVRISVVDTSTAPRQCLTNVPGIRFGHRSPGLTFTTPPAVGDIITMDCRVNRPFKNENWVLDFGFTVTFERA